MASLPKTTGRNYLNLPFSSDVILTYEECVVLLSVVYLVALSEVGVEKMVKRSAAV